MNLDPTTDLRAGFSRFSPENMAANKTIVGWWQQQYGAEQSQVEDNRIDGHPRQIKSRRGFQKRPDAAFECVLTYIF